MNRAQNSLFNQDQILRKLNSQFITNSQILPSSNNSALSKSQTIVCEVVNPIDYKVGALPGNCNLVRVLSGPNFDPISEFVFIALNASGMTFEIAQKVFVLYSETNVPVIQTGFGVAPTVAEPFFRVHGHKGVSDYGYAGFLAGGR